MLKRKRKKKEGYNKYLCFLCNACWVFVGGRQGRTHLTSLLTLILDLFKGFFFLKLNERNGPKDFEEKKLKKLLDFYGMF